MANNKTATAPNFTLKVNITCCATCPVKAKKKLLKLEGVNSILYDAKQGVMKVSGTVDPTIIVKQFAKWGRKAELLSSQKDPTAKDQSFCLFDEPDSNPNPQKTKKCCCSCFRSDSDSDFDQTAKKTDSTMDEKSITKTKKGFFGLFGKKTAGGDDQMHRRGKSPVANEASKWRCPRTPLGGCGCHWATFFSPYGPCPPAYVRPMMGSPYGPYGWVPPMPPPPLRPPPLMPPPYGFFNSRSPPVTNPMVHYTGYEDNYKHW